MNFAALAPAVGYQFRDRRLLQTALTHRSFGADHNERMEFIGDGVLNCAIAVELYRRQPNLAEGDLSRLRAQLVRQDSLFRIAQGLGLGAMLRLGEGELRSGGAERPSILADALEALIGAIYLDAGFDAAAAVIARLYADAFATLRPDGVASKDPKTRLQEWLQARKKALPRYVLQETSGAAHEQRFRVCCEIDTFSVRTIGEGNSRRLAEQSAAEAALKELES